MKKEDIGSREARRAIADDCRARLRSESQQSPADSEKYSQWEPPGGRGRMTRHGMSANTAESGTWK